MFWSGDPWGSLALAARLAGISAAGLALVAAVGCIVAPHRLVRSLLVGLAVALPWYGLATVPWREDLLPRQAQAWRSC